MASETSNVQRVFWILLLDLPGHLQHSAIRLDLSCLSWTTRALVTNLPVSPTSVVVLYEAFPLEFSIYFSICTWSSFAVFYIAEAHIFPNSLFTSEKKTGFVIRTPKLQFGSFSFLSYSSFFIFTLKLYLLPSPAPPMTIEHCWNLIVLRNITSGRQSTLNFVVTPRWNRTYLERDKALYLDKEIKL